VKKFDTQIRKLVEAGKAHIAATLIGLSNAKVGSYQNISNNFGTTIVIITHTTHTTTTTIIAGYIIAHLSLDDIESNFST